MEEKQVDLKKKLFWGFIAFIVVTIWGVTFISMKVAGRGFTPPQVVLIRCIIAYISLIIVHPKFYKSEGLKQEMLYLAAGLCGTTLFVIFINSAFDHTMVSNVSVLSSMSPIFIALLAPLFIKNTKVAKVVFVGFTIATIGTVFIVTNGEFKFSLSILGDSLALLAAISWASYSLILRRNKSKLPQLYVTRRIFLYGILTVIPVIIYQGEPFNIALLKEPSVFLNFLFLGLVAYTGCHVALALVIKNMGAVWTSKFSYVEPIITIIFSAIFLSESISIYMIIGTGLILAGVLISDGILKAPKGMSDSNG